MTLQTQMTPFLGRGSFFMPDDKTRISACDKVEAQQVDSFAVTSTVKASDVQC
jgi:hypothetical protein